MKFNPAENRLMLAEPRRVTESSWLEHVPFALYLTEALRPKRFVELGTYGGVSYCAFCQGAAALKLTDFRSWAVDTWAGDPQAGFYGDQILAGLKAHHDPLYSGFSTLVKETFDQASALLQAERFDLIHIDGLHTYESVKHDYEQWVGKLAEGGVMLFHDTQVFTEGFGVHQLWKELSENAPHFEFHHGSGLGVLAPKGLPPGGLAEWFSFSPTDAENVREYFKCLGARLSRFAQVERIAHKLHAEMAGDGSAFNGRFVKRKIKSLQAKLFGGE